MEAAGRLPDGPPLRPYRFLVVLDLEATCEDVKNPSTATSTSSSSSDTVGGTTARLRQEIIEFPWVVIDMAPTTDSDSVPGEGINSSDGPSRPHLDSDSQNAGSSRAEDHRPPRIIDQQQLYVRPEWEENRSLTAFCTKLTGITDAILAERGQPLSQCLAIFDQAMQDLLRRHLSSLGEEPSEDAAALQDARDLICVATDGPWDLAVQLQREAAAKGLEVPYHLAHRFIDVRAEVAHHYKPGREHHLKGLKSLLKYLGLPHLGRHHSGIDDVLNIAQIIMRLHADGHAFTPERTKMVNSTAPEDQQELERDFAKWWNSDELTVDSLCALLGFRNEEVLNIYQFGSRVYDFQDEDAHWSFVMVMDNNYQGPANFTRGNVHARVHPLWRFEDSLSRNDLYQVISLFLPDRFVWKESVRFDMTDRLNLLKLSRSVLEQFHGLTKSKLGRICKTDGSKLFTKEMLRMFRSVMFGMQLLETGKVIDYRQANTYQREIEQMVALSSHGWMEAIERYQPELEHLLQAFQNKILKEEEAFDRLLESESHEVSKSYSTDADTRADCRLLQSVLRKNSAGFLARHLPFTIRRSGTLVQLCCDEEEIRNMDQSKERKLEDRPPDLLFPYLYGVTAFGSTSNTARLSRFARQCSGIIFDMADDYRIVSLPLPYPTRSVSFADEQDRVAEARLSFMPMFNGALCILYNYKDEWQVASTTSIDASEQVEANTTLRDAFWALWSANGYNLPSKSDKRCYLFQYAAEGVGVFAGLETQERSGDEGILSTVNLCLPQLLYVATGCLDSLSHKIVTEHSEWKRPSNLFTVNDSSLMVLLDKLPPTIITGMIVFDHSSGHVSDILESRLYTLIREALLTLKREPSQEAMLDILRQSDGAREWAIVLQRFPQFANLYDTVSCKFWQLIDRVDAEYHRLEAECARELRTRSASTGGKTSTKEESALFAKLVGRTHPFKQVLFAMRRDGQSASTYFRNCTMKVLLLNLAAI